ncbi:glycosyltransferase [Butyrivibrio proteoclasticus]|uniref:glycosyltransferase n=1 Tax=Butyrivibrio proteoclasticus TaxID=43305 RepID=UPI00047CBAC4|nr:glycosyltransferase [Butyrivibrio proteoclasticus]
MFERLEELIATGDYREALFEYQEFLGRVKDFDDATKSRFYTLEASIWEGLFDVGAELSAIQKGLCADPENYELFYMLYLYYSNINASKAFLCLEMALFYCPEGDDKDYMQKELSDFRKRPDVRVRNVSVMILSYEDSELLRLCVESVEDTMPAGSYEIVVVDNASKDETVLEYLRSKKNEADYRFEMVESGVNLGFPKGCNLGVLHCDSGNDIFFLNNDAVLMKNALFWLRMALYDDINVGAASGISNNASLQTIDPICFEEFAGESLEEDWHKKLGITRSLQVFRDYAKHNSGLLDISFEPRFRFTGFAVLLSRDAMRFVCPDGKVFDEVFSPGYFEDDDLGIRIARAGYKQYLCNNALIYHNGGSGFEGHEDALEKSRQKFVDKWGFDVWEYYLHDSEAISKVLDYYEEKKRPLRILDFTCGFGANSSFIKGCMKDAYVAGVCNSSFAAGIARNVADEVAYGELNTTRLPFKDHSFDVVIADRESVSKLRAAQYLKEDGLLVGYEDQKQEVDINMFSGADGNVGDVSVLTE